MNLYHACQEDDSYSVQEVCEKMRISYLQIQEWANEDDQLMQALDICESLCAGNTERAMLMKRIPPDQAFIYMSLYRNKN